MSRISELKAAEAFMETLYRLDIASLEDLNEANILYVNSSEYLYNSMHSRFNEEG